VAGNKKSVTHMCRTALGALNQWFKWESLNRIRLTPEGVFTTEIWSDPRF